MRRALIVLLALVLGGCATYHHDGGYYDRSVAHGDYYYDPSPVIGYGGPGWYGPYDTLFWGLRYSYFDPFWYPNFHYGVTFFPSYYYGWPYWNAGSYWHWRGYHPYSPHYGSWWDHYYHWQPSGPRRNLGPGSRGYGGNGPERYGSARNAAERLAWQRQAGGVVPIRSRSAAVTAPSSESYRRGRATSPEMGGLPSRRYVPRERVRVDTRSAVSPDDRFSSDGRAGRGGVRAGTPVDAGRFERSTPPVATERTRTVLPSAPERPSTVPIRQSRPEGRSAPTPRVERYSPAPRSSGGDRGRAAPRAERSRGER